MKKQNKVLKAPERKAPKAPTAPEAPEVAVKTIFEIVSISIPNISFTESNDSPETFLRKSGFVSISHEGGRIIASTPTAKDDMIVIEYASKPGKELKPCRLVRIYRGKPVEIETGRVRFVLSVKGKLSELMIEGEKEIRDWELKVRSTDIIVIPEVSFCADEKTVSDGCKPGTSMLSTSEVMIAALVKRTEELSANRPLSAVSLDIISKFMNKPRDVQTRGQLKPISIIAPIVSERPSISAEPSISVNPPISSKPKGRPPIWQNKCITDFMDEHCAGSREMLVLSIALNKFVKAGETDCSIATRLGEYPWKVKAILAVANGLHRDLRPLLDLSADNPERITIFELRTLVEFPIKSQVGMWNIAKKRLNRDGIIASLKVLKSCISSSSVV